MCAWCPSRANAQPPGALLRHPALTPAGLARQLYHALFKDTGTDAPEHLIRLLLVRNQCVDTGVAWPLTE